MAVAEAPPGDQLPLAEPGPLPELVVIVACQVCFRQRFVRLKGGWDIEDVSHDCDADQAFEVIRRGD